MMITGGWNFVLAAYAITWLAFLGYAVLLWRRHWKLSERKKDLSR